MYIYRVFAMQKIPSIIFLISLFCVPCLLCAAPTPPGGGGTTPICWPPPCVPLDGGISILAAAGAAYGLYKVKNQRGDSKK